ncbi:MAG: ATP-grasp domain-containing protein [Candidatus Micrarchaeota archaeon]
MNLAIVSSEDQFEINRIKQEAIKRKHKVFVFSPDSMQAGLDSKKLFDVVLFRVLQGQSMYAGALALSFFSAGSKIVDQKLVCMVGKNKFTNYFGFLKAGLNIPKTFLLNEKTVHSLSFSDSDWIVVKPLEGKRGQGIFKIQFAEIHSFLSSLKNDFYLIQDFIPFEKELRVMVIDGKAIGAFEKQSDNWKKNIALDSTAVKFKLNKIISGIAVKAVKASNLEIAGVDLALHKGQWFVLETNRSPQFSAFESCTKINVALKIVQYLEKKSKKKN